MKVYVCNPYIWEAEPGGLLQIEIILLLPKWVSQTSLAYNVGELCLKNKSK